MLPANSASRAGSTPEASGDWSSGALDNEMKAFLFLIAAFVSASALACSCGPLPPPLKALEQADAVFFAKAIKTAEKDVPYNADGRDAFIRRLAVTFEIQKKIKGDFDTQTVIVFTGLGGGDCGYPFEEKKSYLVAPEKVFIPAGAAT